MKKFLTISNLFKICAAIFGLVAFFLMFADQIYVEILGARGYSSFSDTFFGENGAIITFIGYLLIGISSIAICLLLFMSIDKKIKKFVSFGLALVLILGAVFVFIVSAVINGNTNVTHPAAAPIIAGIFAIVAAIALAISEFAPNKSVIK
ncbi:MAG: hypothetical protein J6Y68_00225 [Clostridia bacterium]|nr:hypothetical protein [Clostridia bacterium]MBP5593712.1 hypothetical protein [Clostridia bacterium]